MPLNKRTKPNQTKPNQIVKFKKKEKDYFILLKSCSEPINESEMIGKTKQDVVQMTLIRKIFVSKYKTLIYSVAYLYLNKQTIWFQFPVFQS